MKVSVIMASYLGEYDGASKDRESKFKRAINSFIEQDYKDKELIIVSDGCEITKRICDEMDLDSLLAVLPLSKKPRINIKRIYLPKQPLFSGQVRSQGLLHATGDIICYLDTDDMFGLNHLSSLVSQFEEHNLTWCYYNDLIRTESGLVTRNVDIAEGFIGTSSIAHIKNIKIDWNNCDGYGHDWKFVKTLVNYSDNYDKIYGTCYIVCHIPKLTDF